MKLIGIGLAHCMLYCAMHLLLIVYPEPLFPYHYEHRNFTVYMRAEVPPEIVDVLNRAAERLSACELNEVDLHHNIFIFNSYHLSRYLLTRNVHFGCNLITGDTFIVSADVSNDLAMCRRSGAADKRRRTLSESIAHEITHNLLRRHLGVRGERAVPSWILEGYCEYIADGCPLDVREALDLLKSRPPQSVPGLPHVLHRLMIEYLLSTRGLTIGEIIAEPPDYRTIRNEVLAGLRANEAAFLQQIGSTIGARSERRSLQYDP